MTIETDLLGLLFIGAASLLCFLPLLCYLCSRMATLGRLDAIKFYRNVARNNERNETYEP